MTSYCHIDFETRSTCDLKKAGAWAYAEHWSTEVMCLSYAVGDYNPFRWCPGTNPKMLIDLAQNPHTIFVAHNAMFEQAIWQKQMVECHGFPAIPVERWDDTMASCAWKALPLALDKAGRALGLEIEKDKEGNTLTLSMSKFDKKGQLPELTSEKLDRIVEYCHKDVQVEKGVEYRVGLLSRTKPLNEHRIWQLDQTINRRGLRIDLDFVKAALQVIERATTPLQREFAELTGGLKSGQRDKVLGWIRGQGVEIENLQKGTITELLGDEEDDSDAAAGLITNASDGDSDVGRGLPEIRLPENVRRVLGIRQMLGSASIKKLDRMLISACEDGRVRGLLQYHAACTGRWGGRLFQPQNFPRGSLKVDPEISVGTILTGDPEYVEAVLGVPAIEAVSLSLRHAIIADPGKTFLVGDYAQIEARIVMALAGAAKLEAFRQRGSGIYLDMAEAIFNRPAGSLDKHRDIAEYTLGKNTILGCGFQMGAKTFHARYCKLQPFEFADMAVQSYRQDFAPEVPDVWGGLQEASWDVIAHGHPMAEAYGCVLRREGPYWMSMSLPSGWQKLWYYRPGMRAREGWSEAPSSIAYKGGRATVNHLYGGLLTENAVQALARGILCAALMRLEKAGYPVVLTVHDEIVCEVPEGGDEQEFAKLMATPTDWSDKLGIPIAVETWAGNRYRK